MEPNKNKDLIKLTELGQYLKSVIEFCILQDELTCVNQIKWNIQYLDYAIISDRANDGKEFFLEIVIVLNDLTLNQDNKKSILNTLSNFFTIETEHPLSRIINEDLFLIIKIEDTLKERFTLKSESKGIPSKFKNYEATVSIESMLRDVLPSAKLVLSSDDMRREEEKLIEELIAERSHFENTLKCILKPIVVCEGITDKTIIETAWEKLYAGKEIPFQITPSGTFLKIEEYKAGGARELSSLMNLISSVNSPDKIVIGLFDNDFEGNNQFKGLKNEVFEDYEAEKIIRKHRSQKIYGMLLPVPEFRRNYFGKPAQRHFSIEHYFSDEILATSNMIGETIVPDSAIFKISGDKKQFSNLISQLDKNAFENMKVLFDELNKLIRL